MHTHTRSFALRITTALALLIAILLSTITTAAAVASADEAKPWLLRSEFLYDTAPFPSCHASTIVETRSGALLAAYFGGQHEKHPEVAIYLSRFVDGQWLAPVEVATGTHTDGKRYPCWNPVLFQPKEGPLLLFYKVGPDPRTWWGLLRTSDDDGKSWSEPQTLSGSCVGPIKNKPVQLASGEILAPSSSEDHGWRVHFERSKDGGRTWSSTGPLNDGKQIEAIQPSILKLKDARLLAIGRTQQNHLFQIASEDDGKTWNEMTLTKLPNPNSGTDAITLADGRHLLIYNHTARGRSPLNLAISDDSQTWQAVGILEDEPGREFSYPAIIQTKEGLIHATYTWQRERIRHAIIDPQKFEPHPLPPADESK